MKKLGVEELIRESDDTYLLIEEITDMNITLCLRELRERTL